MGKKKKDKDKQGRHQGEEWDNLSRDEQIDRMGTIWDKEKECDADQHVLISLVDFERIDNKKQIGLLKEAIKRKVHLIFDPSLPPGTTRTFGNLHDMLKKAGFDSVEEAQAKFVDQMRSGEFSKSMVDKVVTQLQEKLEEAHAQNMLFGDVDIPGVTVVSGNGLDELRDAIDRMIHDHKDKHEKGEEDGAA